MRFERNAVLSCLLALVLLAAIGCDKKTDQPPATARGETTAPAVAADKPVTEVQAEADTMSVENLKATALKYKDAIVAKQADIEKLATKVKEIPLTEALGDEAKTLKADLQNLETDLKALKDRFLVYYNKLKEKGADVAGLTLP
ncbi:MAG: hypothetical protein QM570_03695 [Planctomycetota bacterium]|nr:hypothetical protein [Planctomycetota bacterium]